MTGAFRWLLVAALVAPTLASFVRDAWYPPAVAALWLAFAALVALRNLAGPFPAEPDWKTLAFLAPAIVGAVQLVAEATAHRRATAVEAVLWLSVAMLYVAARSVLRDTQVLERFLHATLAMGAGITAVSLMQFLTSNGRIYWLIDTDLEHVMGPFRNRNHFAAFVELMLPFALVRTFDGRNRAAYGITAAAMTLAVALGGSRMGIVLCGIEWALIAWLAGARSSHKHGLSRRLVAIALAAGTIAAGLWTTSLRDDGHRREMAASTLDLIRSRPLAGHGLGAYETVYPRVARFDNGLIVDHAHNDWLEWAAEIGIPATLPLLAIVIWLAAQLPRVPWAAGPLAVATHALVDFPLHKPALVGWFVVLVAAVAVKCENRSAYAGSGIAAPFTASQSSSDCSNGFSERDTATSRAAQNASEKSRLNWNMFARSSAPGNPNVR